MTVFKGYLLMAKKHIGSILLYFGIFTGLALLVANDSGSSPEDGFAAQKMDILVVDEDNSALSGIVVDYLKKNHTVTETENDKKQLYESLYYQGTDLVIRIPRGMGENAGKSKKVMELTQSPGSFGGIYVEQQISKLVAGILDYQSAGCSVEEAYKKVAAVPEAKVSVLNENPGINSKISNFFRCVPYMFLAGLGSGIAIIIFSFRKKQVKARMMTSSVSLFRQNAEAVMAVFVVGMILYLITLLLALVNFGTGILHVETLPYYLLNLLLDMLLALAMAFFIGMLVKKETVVNMSFTSLSLAFSFLGGAFVSLELLSPKILRLSKLIPVYWYEVVNDLLGRHSHVTGSIKTQIWQAYGMQMIFVLVIFAAGMAVAKYQQQEN